MEGSLLCKIPQGTNKYIYDGWANGTIGTIQDRYGKGIYRFFKGRIGTNGMVQLEELKDDRHAPIVATGIVAYWLHYGIIPNRPYRFGDPQPKSVLEVFKGYTKRKLYDYKQKCELKPSSWRRDLEHEFYTQYIIPYEKRLMKQSEALFEYITPDDQRMVRDIMNEYILYLIESRKAKGYHVSDELKVLRFISSEDECMLENLEHFEVITILDKLESKNYVRIAWIEGHDYEDIMLLDKGRAYMKQLETGEILPIESTPTGKEDEPNVKGEKKERLIGILNTELAREIFAQCIEKGWMHESRSGYQWEGIPDCRGRIAQLCYLCGKIYGFKYSEREGKNIGKEFPDTELCKLFNIESIEKQLVQVYQAINKQKWRTVIDEVFE